MSHIQFNAKARQWQGLFETKAAELSRITGFVQRRSKMTGVGFVQTLVFGWLDHPQASLNELVQVSRDLGIKISVPGLQQRFTPPAVVFLQQMVVAALQELQSSERLPVMLLKPFSAVNIVDSSLLPLPDALQTVFPGSQASPSQLKVYLSYDYLTGQLKALDLADGRSPDQTYRLPPAVLQPNSLTLLDLGFFKKTRFEAIAAAGGYFLSRLQSQTGVYAQPDAPIALDLLALLASQATPTGELAVCLRADQPLPVRLVYGRLPPNVVNQRRRKAKASARRRGETCSKRHLALLEWALFITNVPVDWLSSEQVLLLYRVRWQVEWVFKVWKSQARLNYIGTWGLERVLCQFYGHLLGLICFQDVVVPYRSCGSGELSLAKAFGIVRRYAFRLVSAIAHHWHGVARLLARMGDDFRCFALKTQRRKSPSTYQSLLLACP